MEEQEIPEETRCPSCGFPPTDESVVNHKLSAVGYLHDDIRIECINKNCDESWVCGVPVGGKGEDDLFCESCEETYMMTHRIHAKSNGAIDIHLKCPNCFYFKTVRRLPDDSGLALVGYPPITGEIEGATPYGWKE